MPVTHRTPARPDAPAHADGARPDSAHPASDHPESAHPDSAHPSSADQGRMAALLAAHVPLSLLMDLADPTGPHSRDLLQDEPGAADWLHR